ncbi:MAG: hypothetical protein ACP6IY_09495 [Promethearchaeia archaeon]
MKFKIGDNVLWDGYKISKVIIVRVFEKTKRYEIKIDDMKFFVKAHELFKDYEEYRIDKLNKIDSKINKLKEERKEFVEQEIDRE